VLQRERAVCCAVQVVQCEAVQVGYCFADVKGCVRSL